MKTIAIDGRMWGSGFTGIGNYIAEVGTRLFQQFPEVRFLLLAPSNFLHPLPPNVQHIPADEPIYSIAEQTTFVRKIYALKPDITWFPHFTVPLLFFRPFVVTIHDLTILHFPGKKMRKPWHRLAYHLTLRKAVFHAKHILTVSKYTKNEIQQTFPKSTTTISSVWNGVNNEQYCAVSKERKEYFQKKYNAPFFLVAGVWRAHKNIPNAIRGFEMFRKHGGKGSLVITGKKDPLYTEAEHLAQSSVFFQDIFLTGFIDQSDMPALITAAHALVFPSLFEGFGLPAIEAMACKTPILSSNATSLPEVCGDAALYFDPKSPEDIALRMVDSYNINTRNNLVLKGYARKDLFSWDTAAKSISHALRL